MNTREIIRELVNSIIANINMNDSENIFDTIVVSRRVLDFSVEDNGEKFEKLNYTETCGIVTEDILQRLDN